jgi:putative sterol carrier protein
VADGHEGKPDLSMTADSETWLRFPRKEANLPWALLRRRIRIKGSPRVGVFLLIADCVDPCLAELSCSVVLY